MNLPRRTLLWMSFLGIFWRLSGNISWNCCLFPLLWSLSQQITVLFNITDRLYLSCNRDEFRVLLMLGWTSLDTEISLDGYWKKVQNQWKQLPCTLSWSYAIWSSWLHSCVIFSFQNRLQWCIRYGFLLELSFFISKAVFLSSWYVLLYLSSVACQVTLERVGLYVSKYDNSFLKSFSVSKIKQWRLISFQFWNYYCNWMS